MATRFASGWQRLKAGTAALAAGLLLGAAATPAHAFSWGFDNNGVPLPLSNFPARDRCIGGLNGVLSLTTPANYADVPFTSTCIVMPDTEFYDGTGGSAIRDVDVTLRIRHPRIQDLVILLELIDPESRVGRIPLMVFPGCEDNDYPGDSTFGRDLWVQFDDSAPASIDFSCDRTIPEIHGRVQPTTRAAYGLDTGLVEFQGLLPGGLWTLEIQDYGTTGAKASLLEWQIHVNGVVEADMAPREEAPTAPDTQSGNNIVTETDYVLSAYHLLGINDFDQRVLSVQNDDIRRDVDGSPLSDFVDVRRSSGSEFSRMDCAPASSNGDGIISVADFVQATRYAASVDELVAASTGPLSKDDRMLFAYPFEGSVLVRGEPRDLPVSVMMRTKQAETEVGFGLTFDPELLEFVRVERGSCVPANAIFQVSRETEEPGLVGVRIGVDPDSTFVCDYTVERPILGVGSVGTPTSIGDIDTRPERLLQESTITTSYRPIDFSKAFPEVVVDFTVTRSSQAPIEDYRFDISIPNDKMEILGASGEQYGATPVLTLLDPADAAPSYALTSTYSVTATDPSSSFTQGLIASIRFRIVPGQGLFDGNYQSSYRMPSLRLARPPVEQVIDPTTNDIDYAVNIFNRLRGNATSAQLEEVSFVDLATREMRADQVVASLVPGSLLGDDATPGTPDDINPCLERSVVTVGVNIEQNVRTPSAVVVEVIYDPTVYRHLPAAFTGDGFNDPLTRLYETNEGSLRVLGMRGDGGPDDTFLNGQIGAIAFTVLRNLDGNPQPSEESRSITLRRVSMQISNQVPSAQPVIAANRVTFCPGAVQSTVPLNLVASRANDLFVASLQERVGEPVAPVAARKSTKGIPPSPVNEAKIFARVDSVAPLPSGRSRMRVSLDVSLNTPGTAITSYFFDLSYDRSVLRPICGSQADGGSGFGAVPTLVYKDWSNDAGADDDCFVNASLPEDPFRALPNEPTSNYRTLIVDGRNANSSFTTGSLFTMDFEVLQVSSSELSLYVKRSEPVNRNVEVAKVFFRAKEGSGTVATPIVFGPNPFFDGLAARNPLGSPVYMSFIDTGLTVLDPALARPTVRIVDTVLNSDSEGTVQIALDSVGVETAAGFTLVYDPTDIQIVSATRGRDVHPSGFFYTEPNENTVAEANSNGRLRMLISLQPGAAPGPAQTFQQGTRILANLRFRTRELTTEEEARQAITTSLRFEKLADRREVCDANAIPLETRFPVGTISIAGKSCQYAIAPLTNTFPVTGTNPSEFSTIDITVGSGCPWVAATTEDWITINPSTASGFGNGTVRYSVGANTGPARVGFIEVAGLTHRVEQASCSYELSGTEETFPGDASEGTFRVKTDSICDWRVETQDTWIQITSPRFVIGQGDVTYKVDQNVGLPRTGTITVRGGGGQVLTYTVKQIICTYALVPTQAPTIPQTGGTGTFDVVTEAACPWKATVQEGASWLTITANATGRGPATVSYSAAPVIGKLGREATITVGDQTFLVVQDGCRYDLAGPSGLRPARAETITVSLTTSSDCTWVATLDQTWVSLTTQASGTGSADLKLTLAANTSGAVRTATLNVEGTTYTFSQDFCRFTFNPPEVVLEPREQNVTVALAATDDGCPWTLLVDQPWVSIESLETGSGSANISYRVEANTTGVTRVAHIRVDTETYTITQESCTFSITPLEAFVPSSGGVATFQVATDAGCPWEAKTEENWIGILNPTGLGPATVTLEVAGNFGDAREGTVTVGDRSFTVRQFKRNQFGFDFGLNEAGWEFRGVGGEFTTPEARYEAGALEITLTNNKNSFGFWQSPVLRLDGGVRETDVFLLTAVVRTDVEEQATVPAFRFRVSAADFSQTNELWVFSNGDGAYSPSLATPREYRQLFTLPPGEDRFRAYFDVLGVVAEDAATATLGLDRMVIESAPYNFDLTRQERLYLLADSAAGWRNASAPDFVAPVFGSALRGLTVAPADSVSRPARTIFGYWFNNSDLRIESGRAYQAKFRVSARSARGPEVQRALVPPFRLRINTSSFRAATVVNIDSRDANSRVPGFLVPQEYAVWLMAEEVLAGDRLFFAFDYLLPAGSQDDPAVELTLERLEVNSIPATD